MLRPAVVVRARCEPFDRVAIQNLLLLPLQDGTRAGAGNKTFQGLLSGTVRDFWWLSSISWQKAPKTESWLSMYCRPTMLLTYLKVSEVSVREPRP